jgi:hypothetical protein
MDEQRVDLIERFLSRMQPDWREIARGAEIYRTFSDRHPEVTTPGAPHPDMVVDDEQTRRDRIALGFELPDGSDSAVDDGTPKLTQTEADERADLMAKLDRYRGVDGYSVPEADASTDQLRAALAVAEQREAAGTSQ